MLSGQQQQAAGEMEQQLLAQVMAHIAGCLQSPSANASDGRRGHGDLQERLSQARMHGIGFLINNACKKLRDARSIMDAAPCTDKLLDALLDTLVGIHFLGLLGRPGDSGDAAPATTAGTAAEMPAWSNQHYYHFMEEVVTRFAAPAPDSLDLSGQAPHVDRPYPEASGLAAPASRPAATTPAPAPAAEPPARPYNRMARLRQSAGLRAGLSPQPAPDTAPSPAAAAPTRAFATEGGHLAPSATGQPSSPAGPDSHLPSPADWQAHYRQEAENQAWADYTEQAGQVIYAGSVLTEARSVTLSRPMLFTVLAGANAAAICHWQGNRLRPIWYVRPVGSQPASLKQQASVWIYGHEYYDDAGQFYASSYFTPGLQATTSVSAATSPALSPAAPPTAAAPAADTAPPRSAIEAQAIQAYEAHLGHVIEVQELCGHVKALGDEVIHCVPPARVRVVKTSPDLLLQWRNNELWSQWQVETLSPHSDLAQASRLRIAGPAWRASGERITFESVRRPL